jgi:hypothetical protein
VCNRYVLQGDVELLGTLKKVGSDSVADCFTLGDKFGRIELGNDGLQDFVSNGRKNTFIVILTKVLW